jgi:hypothetical protein
MQNYGSLKRSRTDQFDVFYQSKPGASANTDAKTIRVEDFIVENGEVEREAKTDGVCWWEFSYGDVGGLVSIERLSAVFSFVASCELSEVAVVVACVALNLLVQSWRSLDKSISLAVQTNRSVVSNMSSA